MPTPSDVVAGRVRQVRRKRGLTVAQLAQRCAELGMPGLTEQAIYNLEAGRADKQGRRRRSVSVDELLALAAALNCAPIHLLVPLDDETPYEITPKYAEPGWFVREWVRGGPWPLPGADVREFYSERPEHEFIGIVGEPTNDADVIRRAAAEDRQRQLERWRWPQRQPEGS
jgi:transcriptional regulator with XRE-family HTH domain